jgi:hypothetical protein
MTCHLGPSLAGSIIAAALALAAGTAQAAQPPDTPPAREGRGLAPREIQQMIDAYVLMQAQPTLSLTDEQFPRFVARLKALQDARRQHQVGRNRIIMELNRLSRPNAAPGQDATQPQRQDAAQAQRQDAAQAQRQDAAITQQLAALKDHDARWLAEIARASAALDEVLTPVQQARLRVFEEQMERRKLDLLMRARQAARGATRPPKQP